MRKWFFLCGFTLLLNVIGYAQEVSPSPTPAPFQPIVYQRNLPLSVRRMMPQGAKSVFWGRFLPKGSRKKQFPIVVHFYELWQQEENAFKSNGGAGCTIHFAFDILDVRNSTHPHLLNRIFTAGIYSWLPDRFGVRFYWLNPKAHTQPLFVSESYKGGEYGPSGVEDFVVLGSGWTQENTVDEFREGGWRLGQENIVFVGNDGMLSVRSILFPDFDVDLISPQELDTNYRATFVWESDGFHPTSAKSQFTRGSIGFTGWARQPIEQTKP